MTLFLLAGDSAAEILSDAGWTIAIGLVVVFAVLLLLTGIFKLFGIIMASFEKKDEPATPAAAPVAEAAPVDIGPSVSEAQVRNGISDEETAVIAAAVAASMPAGKPYTIRKIDRAE